MSRGWVLNKTQNNEIVSSRNAAKTVKLVQDELAALCCDSKTCLT
jgi:hypothetical protein